MNIIFKSRGFAKECNQQDLLVGCHGAKRATLIRRRLDELKAAQTLDIMRFLRPARCHELKGSRAGELSVDLDHPYRLVFKPDHDPLPTKPDGGLDWTQVTSIIILGAEDTHD